ncbi:hypothetical protein MAPG_01892 [Magnaporthiopsis poae ATCC 64411]|uniref:Serine hydrolase domain-containing protein n=1 Tax=Magnaporthiopsis poae (strain ATCC 64411 / 73-15) TaxID=644358 RepID=A0A0C4DPW3_MAGP6|nr:hypothetical protein MAPG_01892 [Magnaporthiopsis poae ATCC 64411]
MRFLCLPGAYGSADKFQVQLAPILKELTDDGTATFYFTHGPCKVEPPEGFEEFFGEPPYYRFIEPDEEAAKMQDNDVLSRIRDFPRGETAEDTMRELMTVGVATSHRSTSRAIKYLSEVIARRGPFDGIIGYSEGATVARTLHIGTFLFFLLLYPDDYAYAVIMQSRAFPHASVSTVLFFFPNARTRILQLPASDLLGSLDPYLDGSMALYNVCDPDTAYLFDHAKGHTLPRDRETIKELADVVREAIGEMKEEGLL